MRGGGVAKYRGGQKFFRPPWGGVKNFSHHQEGGQKFFAYVDFYCKTTSKRRFSAKKLQNFRRYAPIPQSCPKIYNFVTSHVLENMLIFPTYFLLRILSMGWEWALVPPSTVLHICIVWSFWAGYSPLTKTGYPLGGVRNFLDHLEGGSKIFDTLDGVGQKFFRVLSRKFRDPPHPVLNEHSLRVSKCCDWHLDGETDGMGYLYICGGRR